MKTRHLPALALPLLLLVGPAAVAQTTPASSHDTPAPDRGVIATVNGEAIRFEDLERLLTDMHSGASLVQRHAPDLDKMLFRLINDTLLAQEARALGMQNDEPIPKRMATKRESLAGTQLEKTEIRDRAEPTDAEIELAFREEYRTITFRLLTVHDRDEAEDLLKQLEDGADLAVLAKEHSVDPYGPKEGLVEDLPKIDMPHELAPNAFTMAPGELAGPLSTRIGWTLLQVDSFGEPDPERFDELERSLGNLVAFRKADALRSDLAARLREAHPVVIDDELLGAIVGEPLPDGRLIPKVEDPEAIVARIGDRTITAEELGKALRTRWKGVRNEEAALAARPLVLERMIRNELMLAEALARGYGDTPEARRELHAYETRLLVPRFLNQVVATDVTVTPEEMDAYYEAHKEAFHRPPRVHLGQITVASEEEAARLVGLLEQGADLAWLARQHSTDPFKDAGGDRGWVVPRRNADSLEEALFEAQPGDVLGPIERGDVFLVVLVGAREEQGIYTLEEIGGNVRKTLSEQKAQQALHDFIQTLRDRSEIILHEDVLATMRITGSPVEETAHSGTTPPSGETERHDP
jgi:parvulin-like peptidyl-prolyl isomerase